MKRKALIYALLPVIFAFPAFSDTKSGEVVVPKIEKLSLFKNGYGFASLVFTPKANQNIYLLKDLPVSVHGTFWVHSTDKNKLGFMSGSTTKVEKQKENYSMLELAQANPDANIRVKTTKGQFFSGKLVPVKKSCVDQEAISFNHISVPLMSFLCLNTSEGKVLIPHNEIAIIEFPDLEEFKLPTYDTREPVIKMQMTKIDPNAPVNISCITPGVTWVPSYSLDISKQEKGILHANAEIINELANLDNIELELISGFPSIQYPSTPSPIMMNMGMLDFFDSLNGKKTNRNDLFRGSGSMSQIAGAGGLSIGGNRGSFPVPNAQPMMMPANMNETVKAEDLFFYPVKNFTCAKGETISVPLFDGTIPYTHIMTWDIPDNETRENERRRQESNNTNAFLSNPNEVWHCIRITNTLETPLTTAPIQFSSNGRFVGQGIVPFTGAGQKNSIRINKAMDVTATDSELILSEEDIKMRRSTYTNIRMKGTLTAHNQTEKAITLVITKNMIGTYIDSSDEGKLIANTPRHNYNNPLSVVTWELSIPAGEEKEITYQYNYIK